MARTPHLATDDEALRWRGWSVTESGCWEWKGRPESRGYGRLRRQGRLVLAHRLAYETWVGPIPGELFVRHKCDNPPCINPDHLETGTVQENNRDAAVRGNGGRRRKLSRDDVEDIRWVLGLGATGVDVARSYSVSHTQISRIKNRVQRNL